MERSNAKFTPLHQDDGDAGDDDDDDADDDDDDDGDDDVDDYNDDHLTPSSPLCRAAREAKDIFPGFFGFLKFFCSISMKFHEVWGGFSSSGSSSCCMGGKMCSVSDAYCTGCTVLGSYLACFEMFWKACGEKLSFENAQWGKVKQLQWL